MRERDGRYKVLEVCGPVWGGREVVVVVVAVVVAEGQSKQVVVVDWGAAGEDGCGHLVDESKEERAGSGRGAGGHGEGMRGWASGVRVGSVVVPVVVRQSLAESGAEVEDEAVHRLAQLSSSSSAPPRPS